MRYILACLLLLAANAAEAQQIRYYEQVGGLFLEEVLDEHRGGFYLPVRRHNTRDTLMLWIGAVGPDRDPAATNTAYADSVVWCYPKKHPDSRHIFPKANRVVVGRYESGAKEWIAIGPYEVMTDANPHLDL